MRKTRLIRLLARSKKDDVSLYAIAFILTEMHFRDCFFRLCEIFLAACTIYILRREPTLTIGIAQVSFQYWRKRYDSNNIALLKATFSDEENYQVCCDYLRDNQRVRLDDIITRYNGKPSLLYVKCFYENLAVAQLLLGHLHSVDRTSLPHR